jgi:hypothetical protein
MQQRDFNRDWALRLAEAGIAIFPCGPDKKPLIKWRNFSSCEVDAIAQWWMQFPNALPAIDLEKSDLVVLDGDRHGGPDGRTALHHLLRQQPDFDNRTTPTALTPSDGAHVYFDQNGHELSNARGDLPDGIDVRGAGGYVIAPYAILPDGQRYRAVPGTPDLITAFQTRTIPYVPQGIVDLVRARKQNSSEQTQGEQPQNKHTNGGAGIREQAYARAALEGCTAELAAAASGSRNELLNKLAFRLGRMIARGWLIRAEVETVLLGAMHANGYIDEDGIRAAAATLRSGLEAGEKEPHPDLEERKASNEKQQDAPRSSTTSLVIKSSKEFVAGFVPPEYVVVGLLQRRFFYSFTGQTAAGKTAIALLLSACAALGRPFAGRTTKQIRVLYLAAENADDVRMRWIALAENMDFDIDTINVYFVEGRFSLSSSLQLLRAEAERQGGEFGLVIVDTGPVFFEGKDENENKQLGDHAHLLRSLINAIPGQPCVLANTHPIKNATVDQLIPRGGGAFLNETDGNLTAAKTDSTVELHWQGKFRGPDFAPMYFLIRTVTHQDLKDGDGRLIPTVIAECITDEAKEDIAAAAQRDENAVLALIRDNAAASQAIIATAIGWKLHSGEPNRTKAGRCIKALIKAKLIKETRTGRYKLTPEGEKALKGETEG